MNKIGFKNFRKFTNFPTIDLGGITVLVGGNNAGKSTLVKAMLLMRDFIQTRIVNSDNVRPVFKFDTEHVSIGNFSRAISRNSRKNGDTITFELGIEKFLIKVDVKGDKKSDMEPIVSTVTINDSQNTVVITINYSENLVSLKFGVSKEAKDAKSRRKSIVNEIEKLRHQIGYDSFKNQQNIKPINLEVISKKKAEIERLEKELKSLDNAPDSREDSVTIELNDIFDFRAGNLLLPEIISGIVAYSSLDIQADRRTNVFSDEIGSKSIIKAKTPLLNSIAERLNQAINNDVIEYIYAHSVSQQVFYNIVKDSSDYVTRAIHEFYQARITEGDKEFEFLCHWLKEFEVGNAIEVIAMKGEAYQVLVLDEKNKKGIDLADKGMGSIQMTILLLRIATLMRKYKGNNLTILLEEPEQNLHPALQSKLADLLLDAHRQSGFQFIVETHSEYLIRKSQVLVAEAKNAVNFDNPFKVYYLPNDGKKPYEMIYRTDGKFSNDFGIGFFDEAANLAFELF